MAFENIEWKLIARDEASRVIDQVTAANKKLVDELKKGGQEAQKSSGSWLDQAKGVFAGVASYNALKTALGAVSGLFKSSIDESINASATMALVQQNVENAGVSYDSISKKLEAYSQSMVQMGFDDENVAESVSRLMLVTGDYNKAIKLNQLAMDLSRSKHIDLAAASNLVTQVTQGNNKVLKQYGIELDDTASASDNLAKLQKKVQGATEAYAQSAAGQQAKVNEQWNNAKQMVGDQLLPVYAEFMGAVSDNMPAITSMVVSFASAISKAAGYIIDLANAWSVWTGTDNTKIEKSLNSNLDVVADRFNQSMQKAGKALRISGEELAKMDAGAQKSIIAEFGKGATTAVTAANDKLKEFNGNFKNIGGGMSDAALSKMNDLKAKLADVKTKYDDAVSKIGEALAKLDADHTDKINSITTKIAELKSKIVDLNAEYDKNTKDLNKSEAERVVEQEQKIKDLQKQIAEAQSKGESTTDLQSQLGKEQDAYNTYMANRKGLDAELVEARRRANETEFARFVEDTNAKRVALEADHKAKLEQIQTELKENQDAAAQEQIVYLAKRQQYLETQNAFTAFHDKYIEKLTSMKNGTQKMVDEMNNKLKTMIDIVGQIESAKNKAGILGAAGMETPTASGSTTGANNITINLGGVSVANNADADALVQKIVRQLQLVQVGSQ